MEVRRPLKRPKLGPPDIYPQDPKQREDELTSINVKQGYTNTPLLSGSSLQEEYGSAKNANMDAFGVYFSALLSEKHRINTLKDTQKKKQLVNTKEIWYVHAKTKNAVDNWFRDLASGTKSLGQLGKRIPIFNSKEQMFSQLYESHVPLARAVWFIKMSAVHAIALSESSSKSKKRQLPDQYQELTSALTKYLKDISVSSMTPSATGTVQGEDFAPTYTQWQYQTQLARYLFDEGLLDQYDFLCFLLELIEKKRPINDLVVKVICPLVLEYVMDFSKSAVLSRRLAHVCAKRLCLALNNHPMSARSLRRNELAQNQSQTQQQQQQQQQQTTSNNLNSFTTTNNEKINRTSNHNSFDTKTIDLQSNSLLIKSGSGHSSSSTITSTSSNSIFTSNSNLPGLSNLNTNQQQLSANNILNIVRCQIAESQNNFVDIIAQDQENNEINLYKSAICMLSSIIQVICIECPTSMVRHHVVDAKYPAYTQGSPLDHLPCLPSNLPMIESDLNYELKRKIQEAEKEILHRSSMADSKWSCDSSQKLGTNKSGLVNRLLTVMDILDKHNFDKIDSINSIELLYSKIFPPINDNTNLASITNVKNLNSAQYNNDLQHQQLHNLAGNLISSNALDLSSMSSAGYNQTGVSSSSVSNNKKSKHNNQHSSSNANINNHNINNNNSSTITSSSQSNNEHKMISAVISGIKLDGAADKCIAKQSPYEEQVIKMLCEWATTTQRTGEHRALVVARLLEKRQAELQYVAAPPVQPASPQQSSSSPEIEVSEIKIKKQQTDDLKQTDNKQQADPADDCVLQYSFQNLLVKFLDENAPSLEQGEDMDTRKAFNNLVMLFSELIRCDVFSHYNYMCTLISRGMFNDLSKGTLSGQLNVKGSDLNNVDSPLAGPGSNLNAPASVKPPKSIGTNDSDSILSNLAGNPSIFNNIMTPGSDSIGGNKPSNGPDQSLRSLGVFSPVSSQQTNNLGGEKLSSLLDNHDDVDADLGKILEDIKEGQDDDTDFLLGGETNKTSSGSQPLASKLSPFSLGESKSTSATANAATSTATNNPNTPTGPGSVSSSVGGLQQDSSSCSSGANNFPAHHGRMNPPFPTSSQANPLSVSAADDSKLVPSNNVQPQTQANQLKTPGETKHMTFVKHFPVPDDENFIQDMNQRNILLYGFGKEREDVRHTIKKLIKEFCKLFHRKACRDINDPGKIKKLGLRDIFNPDTTMLKFETLNHHDQHIITNNLSMTILEMFTGVSNGQTFLLPTLESISFVFDLFTIASNLSGLLELIVPILEELPDVEAQIRLKCPSLSNQYTHSIALCIVGMLHRYNSCVLLLSKDEICSIFESLHKLISNQAPPSSSSMQNSNLSHNLSSSVNLTNQQAQNIVCSTSAERVICTYLYELSSATQVSKYLDQYVGMIQKVKLAIQNASQTHYSSNNNSIIEHEWSATILQSIVNQLANSNLCPSSTTNPVLNASSCFSSNSISHFGSSSNQLLGNSIGGPQSAANDLTLLIRQQFYSSDSQTLRQINESPTFRFRFVCDAIYSAANSQHSDLVNDIAVLCADVTSKCPQLANDWIKPLQALCCSSQRDFGHRQLLSQVKISDPVVMDNIAIFTAVLVARRCLALEQFIIQCAIGAILAPLSSTDKQVSEPGVRLTCHLLLTLFRSRDSMPGCGSRLFQSSNGTNGLTTNGHGMMMQPMMAAMMGTSVKDTDAYFKSPLALKYLCDHYLLKWACCNIKTECHITLLKAVRVLAMWASPPPATTDPNESSTGGSGGGNGSKPNKSANNDISMLNHFDDSTTSLDAISLNGGATGFGSGNGTSLLNNKDFDGFNGSPSMMGMMRIMNNSVDSTSTLSSVPFGNHLNSNNNNNAINNNSLNSNFNNMLNNNNISSSSSNLINNNHSSNNGSSINLGSIMKAHQGQFGQQQQSLSINLQTASLHQFADAILRILCSQRWLHDKCVADSEIFTTLDSDKNILLDPRIDVKQSQRLLYMICYNKSPEKQADVGLDDQGSDQVASIVKMFEDLDVWSMRLSLMRLQFMFAYCKSQSNVMLNDWLDNLAKAVVEFFQRSSHENENNEKEASAALAAAAASAMANMVGQMDEKNKKNLIKGLANSTATGHQFLTSNSMLGGSSSVTNINKVWLIEPLLDKLSKPPSSVQSKIIKASAALMESASVRANSLPSLNQTYLSTAPASTKLRTLSQRGSASTNPSNLASTSLLGFQPFLSLLLGCIRNQDKERETLLTSLNSQLYQAIHEKVDDVGYKQSLQDGLELRLCLIGQMFDTIQKSASLTSDWATLLLLLIMNNLVDPQVDYSHYVAVLDMLATLIHSAYASDPLEQKEETKKQYQNLMKKFRKELTALEEKGFIQMKLINPLMPIVRQMTEVITCEPMGSLVDTKGEKVENFYSIDKKKGLKVSELQEVSPWELIEGHKNPTPLSWTWFGAIRLEQKPLRADENNRLLAWHTHQVRHSTSYFCQTPALDETVTSTQTQQLQQLTPSGNQTSKRGGANERKPSQSNPLLKKLIESGDDASSSSLLMGVSIKKEPMIDAELNKSLQDTSNMTVDSTTQSIDLVLDQQSMIGPDDLLGDYCELPVDMLFDSAPIESMIEDIKSAMQAEHQAATAAAAAEVARSQAAAAAAASAVAASAVVVTATTPVTTTSSTNTSSGRMAKSHTPEASKSLLSGVPSPASVLTPRPVPTITPQPISSPMTVPRVVTPMTPQPVICPTGPQAGASSILAPMRPDSRQSPQVSALSALQNHLGIGAALQPGLQQPVQPVQPAPVPPAPTTTTKRRAPKSKAAQQQQAQQTAQVQPIQQPVPPVIKPPPAKRRQSKATTAQKQQQQQQQLQQQQVQQQQVQQQQVQQPAQHIQQPPQVQPQPQQQQHQASVYDFQSYMAAGQQQNQQPPNFLGPYYNPRQTDQGVQGNFVSQTQQANQQQQAQPQQPQQQPIGHVQQQTQQIGQRVHQSPQTQMVHQVHFQQQQQMQAGQPQQPVQVRISGGQSQPLVQAPGIGFASQPTGPQQHQQMAFTSQAQQQPPQQHTMQQARISGNQQQGAPIGQPQMASFGPQAQHMQTQHIRMSGGQSQQIGQPGQPQQMGYQAQHQAQMFAPQQAAGHSRPALTAMLHQKHAAAGNMDNKIHPQQQQPQQPQPRFNYG